MRVRHLASAAATALAVALIPAAPVAAQAAAPSISVSPLSAKPGEAYTVTGTSDCASVAYTVTLTYTDPDGADATTTTTGTTDASGEFTQAVTVPDTASAFDPASVTASVECDGGPGTSNTVDVEVAPHQGTLTVSPDEGQPGTVITVSGTNCWGSAVEVVFGDGEEFDFADRVEDVTLAPDKTFEATYTVTGEAPPGGNVFAAACPGTEYAFAPFHVVDSEPDGGEEGEEGTDVEGDDQAGGSVGAPGSGPALPVAGTPTFTG